MRNTILECIYNVLRSYPEAPFNSRVIADTCVLTTEEVESVLDQLIDDGFIMRKEGLTNAYRLTAEGLKKATAFYAAHGDVTGTN
jgi:predicted transcriptional regulator